MANDAGISSQSTPATARRKLLPGPLLATLTFVVFVINTLLWAVPVYLAILIKVLTPRGALRDRVSRLIAWLAQHWAITNSLVGDVLIPVQWEVRIAADVRRDRQYLCCSNHQSWNDIYVLMKTFGRRAPFFKFFIKQELIWVPVLGLAWWGLDFPFMKRYTPEQLAANPALKGKDLETTRKACANFRNQPALILNFLEGTRYTRAKHDRQQSPYTHLLKPKSGGFAFALSALGEQLNSLLDVTIVYPGGARGFWEFLAGGVRKVIVEVRQLTIPHELFTGNYESDPEFRQRFQVWIARLWQDKDRRIGELLAQNA